jgi:hypothetical protein
MANLLVNISTNPSGTAPASWGAISGLSASGITVQATNSVLLLIATVPLNPSTTDCTVQFRFVVNGTATNSPVNHAWMDTTNGENSDCTICWAVTGLSGSSNSFGVQWMYLQGNSQGAHSSNPSTLQVIEIEDGNASIIADQSSTSGATAPASWGNLFSQSSVSVASTDSILLFLGCVPMATQATDARTEFRFALDGSPVTNGAVTSSYCDR